MSLKEKWEKYAIFLNASEREEAQKAFYAGAEAALKEADSNRFENPELEAEVDLFRRRK